MKKRSVIIYWLLMLIPAVAICLAAVKLLVHEQERITSLARDSRHERARSIAETLQITIDTVEDELRQALFEIPANRRVETLLKWETSNPLIRNVFVWDETAGLKYPLAGMASTAEERRFMDRFDGLFSGRIPWTATDDASGRPEGTMMTDRDSFDRKFEGQPHEQTVLAKKTRSSRQELVDLVRSREPAAAPSAPAVGWLTRSRELPSPNPKARI